ncbi:MAG TPA: amidase [Actinomycetales bacterium]|nr:amidase [Actinomycetales bacterium]
MSDSATTRTGPSASASTAADELCFTPATELARLLREKQVSARELLEAHLDRIERVNPAINAIVTMDVDAARAEAARADETLASGHLLGVLHGLPAAHKDTHATGGMRTTSGSPTLAQHVPPEDELVVARMRTAGAVRVGKTNVPEFAAGSHTFNPVFGVTRNPYALDRSAGGSSGGAAAALAAGLVPVAEGSDMGGSLRNPAGFCNVVGLRPTPGRVPQHPAVNGFATLSVQGPMGRTVADVALSLAAMAGPDARVPISLQDEGSTFAPPLPGTLQNGLRVAWAPTLGGRVPVDAEVREQLAGVPEVFAGLGADVTEDCPDLDHADDVFGTLRAWLFELQLGEVARRHPDEVKQAIHWNVEKGRQLTGADVARAEAKHTRLYEKVVEFFERYDVLLAPTTQVVPFDIDQEYPTLVDGQQQESYLDWMRSCTLISATGAPALSVPAGFTSSGLPVGLQVIGPPRADRRVLEVGHVFEQATHFGARRPQL